MYQPDFPPVPFRLGLYPVVDSVQWIERLLDAGVRTLQLRIKDPVSYTHLESLLQISPVGCRNLLLRL